MAKYVTRKYHIIVLLYVAFLVLIGKTYKIAIKSIKSYKLEANNYFNNNCRIGCLG